MPRKPIDYSNTIIYKLCCNDPTITDIYVGHTTNWTNRKTSHKRRCTNKNDEKYNFYVYQFIRDHGNWTNWSMIQIDKICCVNEVDACKHERRYFELLGATLNSNYPSRTKKEYSKEYCEKNKEKIIEYRKKYYEENIEKESNRCKKYRENNVEKEKERHKTYYENNIEKVKETSKKYYEENIEKKREQGRNYYEENADKINEKKKKYYEENIEKERQRCKTYRENNVEKEKERHRNYYELQKHIKLETERLFDIDI
jgi:hypothetical protein